MGKGEEHLEKEEERMGELCVYVRVCYVVVCSVCVSVRGRVC